MDTALVKAEADPKVNSYWYQAQDFFGTLGGSEVGESESQNPATPPSLQGHCARWEGGLFLLPYDSSSSPQP